MEALRAGIASRMRIELKKLTCSRQSTGGNAGARRSVQAGACVPNRVTAQVSCDALSVIVWLLRSLKRLGRHAPGPVAGVLRRLWGLGRLWGLDRDVVRRPAPRPVAGVRFGRLSGFGRLWGLDCDVVRRPAPRPVAGVGPRPWRSPSPRRPHASASPPFGRGVTPPESRGGLAGPTESAGSHEIGYWPGAGRQRRAPRPWRPRPAPRRRRADAGLLNGSSLSPKTVHRCLPQLS